MNCVSDVSVPFVLHSIHLKSTSRVYCSLFFSVSTVISLVYISNNEVFEHLGFVVGIIWFYSDIVPCFSIIILVLAVKWQSYFIQWGQRLQLIFRTDYSGNTLLDLLFLESSPIVVFTVSRLLFLFTFICKRFIFLLLTLFISRLLFELDRWQSIILNTEWGNLRIVEQLLIIVVK